MITVLRAKPWFEISPFQRKRKKNIREWNTYTNSSVYAVDEIKAYQDKHNPPTPLKTIKPDNIIQIVFLPFLLLSFVVFITLGFKYGNTSGFTINSTDDVIKVLIQSIAYASFLVFSVLSFAHQYIRDAGLRAWKEQISNKFEKAIELARKRDAFKELKKISLVSQKSVDFGNPNSLIAFVVAVDDKHYVLVTDADVDTIIIVKEFEDPSLADAYVWGENQQAQQSSETEL
jgi:hypothetical protein